VIYLLLTWLAAPFLWWWVTRKTSVVHGRILVIQTAKIGDFVATTPVFRALHKHFPNTKIVALLHPVNVPLAEQLDSIDQIVSLPKQGFKGWSGKRWLFEQLSTGYDGVLVLSPNLTTLLVPFWAGVPQRVSVLGDRRQGSARLAWPFLTYGQAHVSGRMFRETALRSLAGFGLDVDAALLALPNEAPGADSGVVKRVALFGEKKSLIGLGLGAGNKMKALAPEQLKEIAQKITAETNATVVLIGTAEDHQLAAEMYSALPEGRVIDTTGQFGLAELPSLLAGLDCFVGVDSGATYIADAQGVPVVDFMGPADADDQRPIGECAVVIRSTEPCAPCSHAFDAPYRCHLGTRACITNAPIESLNGAVIKILTSESGLEK
jgi:ADP-heptose:LPS heptosyltransferase